MEFTFPVNPETEAWRAKITGIYLKDDPENFLPYFTINEPGKISNDGIGWASGATFTFVIKADGYEDIEKTVTFAGI